MSRDAWGARWQDIDRQLSPRRTQLLVLLGLTICFATLRWFWRLEPPNSDDMALFELSANAVSGHHWLFGVESLGKYASEGLSHQAMRIGLLPVAIPVIKVLGANATAYYVVPLLFSLVGAAGVYWVMLTCLGPLVALAFAVIHMAWPFELEHASIFFTDVPSASLGLVSLCLLDVASRRDPGRPAYALLAGLAALESQFLRNNALVLLAPAYLLLLLRRPTRVPTLWAGAVILIGLLGQQALLVHRGLGWGYDWRSVRKALFGYSDFLPVYSWSAFLVRQFRYQVSSFGLNVSGILAAALVLGSLAGHVTLLRYERRTLLLSIATFGVFTWLAFSFSIYERVPGGVRAMAPMNFRYIQPFTYSSLVVWAWLWWKWSKHAASVALPLLLVGFSYLTSALRLPETYRDGGTRRLARTIQTLAARGEPLIVLGMSDSLRVPHLFCNAGSFRQIEWRELSPEDLSAAVQNNSEALVLRDVPRELHSAQYLVSEVRQTYRRQLAQMEETLWHDYGLEYVDAKYALFAAPRSGADHSAEVVRRAGTTPAPESALLEEEACHTLPSVEGTSATLVPRHAGRSRTVCEYVSPEDALVMSKLDPSIASMRDSGFVLRLNAEYEAPLAVNVQLVEYGERHSRAPEIQLLPGTSYVPVPLPAGLHSIFIVYRVSSRGAFDAQSTVRIRPAEWRLHPTARSEPLVGSGR